MNNIINNTEIDLNDLNDIDPEMLAEAEAELAAEEAKENMNSDLVDRPTVAEKKINKNVRTFKGSKEEVNKFYNCVLAQLNISTDNKLLEVHSNDGNRATLKWNRNELSTNQDIEKARIETKYKDDILEFMLYSWGANPKKDLLEGITDNKEQPIRTISKEHDIAKTTFRIIVPNNDKGKKDAIEIIREGLAITTEEAKAVSICFFRPMGKNSNTFALEYIIPGLMPEQMKNLSRKMASKHVTNKRKAKVEKYAATVETNAKSVTESVLAPIAETSIRIGAATGGAMVNAIVNGLASGAVSFIKASGLKELKQNPSIRELKDICGGGEENEDMIGGGELFGRY